MRKIYSSLTWLLMVISACILTPIVFFVFICAYPFDPSRKVVHKLSVMWGLHYYWFNPLWKIDYKSDADIDTSQPYIVVSNHQSMFDICSLYRLPLQFKWVSKIEALQIPFVGPLLKMRGDILISRGDRQSTKRLIKDATHWIDMGCSICIFPEGTRSLDGRLKTFKEGAFLLARLNKLPILPVVSDGNRNILPPNSANLGQRTVVKMHVLPIISAETVSTLSAKELSDQIYTTMLEEHKKMVPERYKADEIH